MLREYLILKKQGYDYSQIYQIMTAKERNQKAVKTMIFIDRNKMILLLSLLIIAAVSLMLMLRFGTEEYVPDIQDIIVDPEKENLYVEDNSLQYAKGSIITSFVLDGFYEGERFVEIFEDRRGNILIRVGKDMDPYDGIPEGFITESITDSGLVAYILFDEDWRIKYPDTNIVWGADYEHSESYLFENGIKGIYTQQIYDDISRFSDNMMLSYGGILAGKINTEDIKARDFSNTVFIRLR